MLRFLAGCASTESRSASLYRRRALIGRGVEIFPPTGCSCTETFSPDVMGTEERFISASWRCASAIPIQPALAEDVPGSLAEYRQTETPVDTTKRGKTVLFVCFYFAAKQLVRHFWSVSLTRLVNKKKTKSPANITNNCSIRMFRE